MRKVFQLTLLVLLGSVVAACGGDGRAETADYPYNADETTIIGAGTGTDVVATPNGKDCIQVSEFNCVAPQDECGDNATADVVVDADGNVVDTICYPTSGASVENVGADAVPVHKTQNNSVVVLDDLADGEDIVGDLSVDANNVVIWGENPDVSVIGGNVDVTKNNAIIRGVRITGDVTIDYNNAHFLFCVIEGDLTINGNNDTIAGCEVWGDITINGENAVLVSNRLADAGSHAAQGLVCNDNLSFVDANDDGVVDDDELGAPVVCDDKQ